MSSKRIFSIFLFCCIDANGSSGIKCHEQKTEMWRRYFNPDMYITKRKYNQTDYDTTGIRRNYISKRLPITVNLG